MTAPRTELSAFDIGCVVVGGIVGVGIFFTPHGVALAVDTPGQVLLAWGLGGVLAVLGALVFAELSQRVPGHGGVFRYLEAAFGRTVAFLYGWANWLVIQSGAYGVIALVLVDHLERVMLPATPWSADAKVAAAVAVMLVFPAVNVLGLRTGKRVQNALIVLKVLALGCLVALAWFAPARPPEALPPPSGRSLPAMLASAILPVLFATGGWQQGSFVAGAARSPRSVAFGILGGVLVVVALYTTVNLAYLDLLGFTGAREHSAIGAAAAEVAIGARGGQVLAAMVVLSAAGILNTICMAPPYVLYTMAQHGCFPAPFGRLHPRFGTPVLGVLTQGLWAVVLLLLVHLANRACGGTNTTDVLGFVCDGVVFADWLFYGLAALALLRLRRRGAPVAGAMPGNGLVALLFALGALAVTCGAIAVQPAASATGAALVALGLIARKWLG